MPLVSLEEAAARIRAGALVGLPTETVYGLAADALNPEAVRSIFARKGRPADHPLILHVLGDPDVHAFADARAVRLAQAFWPGPLTLVLPKRPHVPDVVTGGHPTVAVRAPDHPLALALLRLTDLPLAAPSANRFGRVSPTCARHVLEEFPDLPVLDGGPCLVGVESTIVDLSGPVPALLRPGGVPVEAIERLVGPLLRGGATPAPGTLRAHYAPNARVVPTDDPTGTARRLRLEGHRVAVLRAGDPETYARTLYAALREADDVDVIVAEWAADGGVGDAINDRLRRAAAADEGELDGTP